MDIKFKDNAKLKLSSITKLEYIEATGTQYINTGIKNSSSLKYDIEFYFNSSTGVIFGSDDGSYNSSAIEHTYTSSSNIGYCYGNQNNIGNKVSSSKYHLHLEYGEQYLKDASTQNTICASSHTVTFTGSNNIVLFALNRGGNIGWLASAKIYYFKVFDSNDNLIFDLIPAKDSNNIICFYDTVSKTCFYNQGTGDFVAGPIVPNFNLPNNFLLEATSFYHKSTPNVNGFLLLNTILDAQENENDIVLSRIRVDIGNVSGSLTELLKYTSFSGFNDNYEPQTKPRLVGTWTINDWYTTTQLAQAQAAFDGLTIVGDPTKLLDFTQMAVQVLDPNEDNYNPAVAIILQGKTVGTTMTDAPLGYGRWFITKTVASTTNFGYNWFYGKTTLTDTNGIVTSDKTAQYDFDEFDECQYFPGIPSLEGNYGGFYQCTKLERITLPSGVTSIPTSIYGGFRECTSLKTINLDNITSLGGNAFERCYNLELTSLPAAITTLGICTFNYCVKLALTSLNSITELDGASYKGTFYGCTGLAATLTEIPATMTKIGSGVFRDIYFPYLHLLPTTPPTGVDSFTFSHTGKLYVGDGSSAANDNAILATYSAATGWSNLVSKLDTWYNYLHP